MRSKEKAELLKKTIVFLYSKEGRSISYISRLLEINRKTLSEKIKEWDIPAAPHKRHMTKSTEKFLKKNKLYIKSRLDKNIPITKIASSLKVDRTVIYNLLNYDDVLKKAHSDYIERLKKSAEENRQVKIDISSREYFRNSLPEEEWKRVFGFPKYEVSNMGRVRTFAKRYSAFYLLRQEPNKNNGRLYVSLVGNKGRKNLQVSRLVAHAFVPGESEEKNTVNHIDGDTSNNRASNLEWVSQSDNNKHAYSHLNRPVIRKNKSDFSKVILNGSYEFKTVAALARFMKKSETQVRRYLEDPEKHNLTIIR